MTVTFNYAARSDVGLMRSVNQDSGYAGPHLLVLADGMGGPAGGDVASSVAIAHLAPLDGDSHGGDMLALIREAVAHAHAELRERAQTDPELAGLGTTLIAALRSGKRLALAHIGDSRAYLVRDGVVSRLTVDHTYVQHLVDLGQITEEEAETHSHRSVILRVLGDHDFGVELDESLRELAAGDRFLLCSDGVSSYVSAETIAETLLEVTDPGECAEQLVDYALRAGGPDNITAVIADVVELDDLPDGAAPSTVPQVVGAAAAHWKQTSRGATSPAARAAALTPPTPEDVAARAERSADEEEEASDRRAGRRRRRRILIGAIVAALLVLGGGAWAGYRWTQTQYYVSASGEFVAIYQGIPQSIGPLHLSQPHETTNLRLADLPDFARDRLERIITPADGSLAGAEGIVESLRDQATPAGGTPTPAPTVTPLPGPSPSARPSLPTPSPGLSDDTTRPTDPPATGGSS